MAEGLIAALLVVSGLFGLAGSFGLLKLPDLMTRLHAPTKATTLGVGAALAASMLHSWLVRGAWSFQELIVTLFLFLTAPVTAQFIAKAHLHHSLKPQDLPDTGTTTGWAGFDDAAESGEPAAPPHT